MDITQLLTHCVNHHASDLHLSTGMPPIMRVDGDLQRLDFPILDKATTQELLYAIMNVTQQKKFISDLAIDFSFTVAELARFRANVFNHQRGMAGALRPIPNQIQSLAELNLPRIFSEFAQLTHGLVLITGPTGSGKSTTLAAIVDHINTTRQQHIITIEDPLEFIHDSKQCVIHQREVGRDTLSFNAALRAALREDPDIILLGELRDLTTIRLALTAAETGHLVFATLHTSSAATTINRIIDVFPGEEQHLVRSMLSLSLQAVVSQRLIKRKENGGRCAVHEIMICTPAIRNLIREAKVAQIYSAIQTGGAHGMQTMEQALQMTS